MSGQAGQNAMRMPRYRSHKTVRAAPIIRIGPKTSVDTSTVLIIKLPDGSEHPFVPVVAEMADKAAVGDYAVQYDDGYRSVSPRKAFEDGYTLIDGEQ